MEPEPDILAYDSGCRPTKQWPTVLLGAIVCCFCVPPFYMAIAIFGQMVVGTTPTRERAEDFAHATAWLALGLAIGYLGVRLIMKTTLPGNAVDEPGQP